MNNPEVAQQEVVINCIDGNDTVRELVCKYCTERDIWRFNVYFTPENPCKDFFELRLIPYDINSLMVDSIQSNRYYSGMGIPEVLLPIAAKVTSRQILSSSNMSKIKENERRSPEATKMWDRLVMKGLAYKDNDRDRYILILP